MVWTLGLTGGIGAGKSTAARIFRRADIPVVDADAVSRALTAVDGRAVPAIAAAFGDDFIDSDGAMDRAKMRALVFEDRAARRRLEAILQPMIEADCDAALCDAKALAAAQNRAFVVFDCPLLLEAYGARGRCDRILVIDLCEAEQIRRTTARSGLTEARVRSIIAAQMPRGERLAQADDILYNGGSPETLEQALIARYSLPL